VGVLSYMADIASADVEHCSRTKLVLGQKHGCIGHLFWGPKSAKRHTSSLKFESFGRGHIGVKLLACQFADQHFHQRCSGHPWRDTIDANARPILSGEFLGKVMESGLGLGVRKQPDVGLAALIGTDKDNICAFPVLHKRQHGSACPDMGEKIHGQAELDLGIGDLGKPSGDKDADVGEQKIDLILIVCQDRHNTVPYSPCRALPGYQAHAHHDPATPGARRLPRMFVPSPVQSRRLLR
jgi:hypothetical protein